MFREENCTSHSANVLEERELLQQMVSLGVGYPYGRSELSKAAISDANMLHRSISRTLGFQENLDAESIIREAQGHIRNGDDGYYLLDLQKGHMLAKGQHPIEDIIIDFTPLGASDSVLLRRKKGTRLHGIGFLITPKTVYFWGMDTVCIPLNEFHLLSFISLNDNFWSGFVVDYDAAQNNRPLVLFPCEENSDIIQSQLDKDDRCLIEEYELFARDTGFDRKNR